jgi:alkylhydroperoxidase family enzyme
VTLLEDKPLVDAVLADFESSPLTEKDKVLFRYLAKVNDTPGALSQADVDVVKAAGWSDAAIFDAVTVCAIFNFFNRWIDGTGVPNVPPEFYSQRAPQDGRMGYRME